MYRSLALAGVLSVAGAPCFAAHDKCPGGPTLIEAHSPQYPEAARKARMQGSIVLAVTLSREGDVKDVSVTRGVNPLLDNSAKRSVRTWRFAPFEQNASAETTVGVNFVLA